MVGTLLRCTAWTSRTVTVSGEAESDKPSPYYYTGNYSSEGCIRSCFQVPTNRPTKPHAPELLLQKALIDTCGCGDPRMPVPEGVEKCGIERRSCFVVLAMSLGRYRPYLRSLYPSLWRSLRLRLLLLQMHMPLTLLVCCDCSVHR